PVGERSLNCRGGAEQDRRNVGFGTRAVAVEWAAETPEQVQVGAASRSPRRTAAAMNLCSVAGRPCIKSPLYARRRIGQNRWVGAPTGSAPVSPGGNST